MNLKKVVSIVLALAFLVAFGLAGVAQANLVWNGNFDYSGGGSVGWPRGNTATGMTGTTILGQSALGSGSSGTHNAYELLDAAYNNDGALYTVLNSLSQPTAAQPANIGTGATANPGWIPGAPSETYTLSFQYYVSASTATATVQLYYYNVAGAPPYDVNSQSYNYVPGGL